MQSTNASNDSVYFIIIDFEFCNSFYFIYSFSKKKWPSEE